jgi:hypothetical protein
MFITKNPGLKIGDYGLGGASSWRAMQKISRGVWGGGRMDKNLEARRVK